MSNVNKLAQIRTLQKNTDRSLQYLINEVYKILKNPIMLYDIDWKILAYPADVVTDDPIWNNHINGGTVNENIDTFINEGFVNIMILPDKAVFLNSENLKYNRIFGKVYDKDNLPIACISVVASNKPFDDDDLSATEAICTMLAREIIKIPYYQNYAQKKMDTYINILIHKGLENIKDKLYASGYISMIYKGLKDNIYVAVADISQCDPKYEKLDYYRDLFKQIRPGFKYSIYSNYIVIIMSTDEAVFYPKKCFNRLNRLFEQDNIKVGVSSRFENLFEMSRYYDEAVKALNNGKNNNSDKYIFSNKQDVL